MQDRSATRVRHGLAASPRTVTRARGHECKRQQAVPRPRTRGVEKSIAEMEETFVRKSGRVVSETELRERQAFFADVQGNKARIRDVERSTINPHSRFIARWDICTACALFFTALVTPFEVGFYDRGTKMIIGPVNFFFNRLVDLIFLIDSTCTHLNSSSDCAYLPHATPSMPRPTACTCTCIYIYPSCCSHR